MYEIAWLGYVYIPMSIMALFLPIKYMIGLTVISSVFQAASVFTISGNSISPFLFMCVALCLKGVIVIFVSGRLVLPKWFIVYLLFLGVMVVAYFISPVRFGNLQILVDSYSRIYTYLADLAVNSSLRSIVTLIVYILAAVVIYNNRMGISGQFVMATARISVTIVLIVGFAALLIPRNEDTMFFWRNLIYSDNESTSIEALGMLGIYRFNGTFKEASYCGGFLSPVLTALLLGEKKKDQILMSIVLIAAILNASSTGLVVLLGGVFVYFLKGRNVSLKSMLVACGIFGVLAILVTGNFHVIDTLLFQKLQTSSGIQRTLMNQNCWDVLLGTKLLGVGFNHIRGSSFLFSMLGQSGVVGTALLIVFVYKVFVGHTGKINWEKCGKARRFAIVYMAFSLFGQVLAQPDIFLSNFWFGIFLLILTDEAASFKETQFEYAYLAAN
jgi:hypothetical protein